MPVTETVSGGGGGGGFGKAGTGFGIGTNKVTGGEDFNEDDSISNLPLSDIQKQAISTSHFCT